MSGTANVGTLSTLTTNIALLQTQLAATAVAAGALSTQLSTFNGNALQISNVNYAELNTTISAYITEASVMATLLTNLKSFISNAA